MDITSPRDPDSLIDVVGLSRRYGHREVVTNLTFSVGRGEILGMLGPNGAGKTTTLRMLVGLVAPTAGRVILQGYSLANDRARALASVGAIMEESHFYPYLSGVDNLRQIARMRSLPTKTAALRDRLNRMGLTEAALRPVRQYSLGMRQRLALAAALMVDPNVLILDEPMNGLDPAGIKDLRDRLRALAQDGVAMVLSSHLLSEVEELCDHVIMLDQGRLIGEEGMAPAAPDQPIPILFRVDDARRAEQALVGAGVPAVVLTGEQLTVTAPAADTPELVRRLVAAEVAIYSVVPGHVTLESRYLARTGRSGEEVS